MVEDVGAAGYAVIGGTGCQIKECHGAWLWMVDADVGSRFFILYTQ